jgi:hypothetical protein
MDMEKAMPIFGQKNEISAECYSPHFILPRFDQGKRPLFK